MESKTRRIIVAACGTGSLLIGIAAIAIPLIASAGTSTTSADSVELRSPSPSPTAETEPEVLAEPAAQVIGALDNPSAGRDPARSNLWRVPVDAPFSTMPSDGQCSEAQIAWLLEHAEPAYPTGRMLDVKVRNAADTGGSMSLANIRADGDLIDGTQVVTLQCWGMGGGGTHIIALPLDGSAAVWGPPTGWEDDAQPEGAPATLNLAPGELADVSFVLEDSSRRFDGRIMADLVAPGTGSVVLAEGLSVPSTPVPGYYLSFANGTFECTRPEQPAAPCSFADAEQLLGEAAAR